MKLARMSQILGATLLVLAINVAVSVVWVAFYAYVINPGHEAEFYQAYAQVAAPYSSILAGFPLVYLFGRWVGTWGDREAPIRNAMTLWAFYAAIDVSVLIGAGALPRLLALSSVSLISKGVAAYLGGRAADRPEREAQ